MNIEQITEEIKKTYPETCALLQNLNNEEFELFCKKQFDYGPTNITVGQDLNTPEGRRVALCAIIFRLNDKVQRLLNLVVKKGVTQAANEPIEDAFKDLALLSKIALIVDKNKWAK